MTSIVLELQQEAMDKNIEISDLLRKALVVATKLNITDFITWVNQELKGYKDYDSTPEYRRVTGSIIDRLNNVDFKHVKFSKEYLTMKVMLSITSISTHLKNKEETLALPYPENITNALIKKIKDTSGIKNINIEPVLQVEYETFEIIVEDVRNTVLEYALKLAPEGVTGISFSTEKKQKASQITYNTINISNMHNSQLQQSSATANQTYNGNLNINDIKSLIKEIKAKTPNLNLSDQDLTKLNSKIEELEKQINLNTPQDNIIKQCLTSIGTIFKNAAFTVVTNNFISWINKIIPILPV